MNKIIRKILTAVLAAAALGSSVLPARAHEAVDVSRTDCSLTIEMRYDKKPVAGGTLTLYRVGSIKEDDGNFCFAWLPELQCTADISKPESAETAAAVLECVKKQKLTGITEKIGKDGKASFGGLKTGLYLVEQQTAASGFEKMKPFLISVPRWEDEHYNYAVSAAAKAELKKKPSTPPGNPPTPPHPKEPRLPQTGQLNWPIPLLIGAGILLAGAGFILRRKKKDA